jgi:uncharacterized protein (DUF2147 family)
MKLLRMVAPLVAVLALAAPAFAEDDAADLVGTWKRDDGKLFRLDLDPGTGEVVGKMLEPPAVETGSTLHYSVEIHLKAQGKAVTGRAIWTEPNPDKDKPGQPPSWSADAVWKLELTAPGKLEGESEWLDWGMGRIIERGFDKHTLERLPVVTLGGKGAAPEKVDAAAPIDEKALAGTWKTAGGARFAFQTRDGAFVVEKVPGWRVTSIKLANEGNVLKGVATWEGGAETKVELALTAPGRLEGRAERLEGTDHGWSPWALDRLPRIDATGTTADAPLGAAEGRRLPLDLKRDDALYLRLAEKGDALEGDLVAKGEAGPRAHVVLTLRDDRFVGTATFQVDGAPVEAHWELVPLADGSIDARCEWLDWDPATKTVVARGATGHKFRALRRIG